MIETTKVLLKRFLLCAGLLQHGRMHVIGGFTCVALAVAVADGTSVGAVELSDKASQNASGENRFKPFKDLIAEATKSSGLIDLYRTRETVFASLEPKHFEQLFLLPIAVARGAGSAGLALNFDEQWVVAFKRFDDQVQLVRKNYRYEATPGTPLGKAVAQNYADSVLATMPIVCDDSPRDGVVVDLGELFLANLANLPSGSLERTRSRWHSVHAYPTNLELEVELTFNGRPLNGATGANGDDGVADPRGATLVLHYSLVQMPDDKYRPRCADERLGHFYNTVKKFDSNDPDTPFVRRLNRWRLEKADPSAPLSPPIAPLVWWIEDTVPYAYRRHVEEGILEWNKAFEAIGFDRALQVRWKTDDDDFAPEDVRYCTFRWVTSPVGTSLSNIRTNPITGEIIDGDVNFDASWVRYWRRQRAFAVGDSGLTSHVNTDSLSTGHESVCERCAYVEALADQLQLAAWRSSRQVGGDSTLGLPDEALGQLIKQVVMHEVGHSLGLRHNFCGSTLRPLEALHDLESTRREGMVGSVMDYVPVNLALPGERQGDYAPTTLGPYDYWAIEYAYRTFSETEEESELDRIAARSTERGLDFADDDDWSIGEDPYANQYDLGEEPLEYARHTVALADAALASMLEQLVPEGNSWRRLRPAIQAAVRGYANAARLALRYVGGKSVRRHARGDGLDAPNVRPVAAARQREALHFLLQRVLVDRPLPLTRQHLQFAAREPWSHWGVAPSTAIASEGLSYFEIVDSLHRVVLEGLLGRPETFRRVAEGMLLAGEEQPLQISEIFAGVQKAVWGDAGEFVERERLTPERRDLQRLHVRLLLAIVDSVQVQTGAGRRGEADIRWNVEKEDGFPGDAQSLARAYLRRIHGLIEQPVAVDEMMTNLEQAHLDSLRDQIGQALYRAVESR
ncbi:MAG: zinc-dependent metalloprotease [Planctomycetales bacterium]|nr:zinc-dependent metalloprotease [Planctomycetales bacterium]